VTELTRPSNRTVRRRAREAVWTGIVLVALIAGGLAVVRWLDNRADRPTATARPSPRPSAAPSATGPARPADLPAGVPANAQRIKVAFARDGDTLEANAAASAKPIATTDRIIIRLLGIDAPETHGASGQPQCYSRDAYKALQRLTPNGSTAFVVADKQLHDQYQRYLLYMWNSKGVFVNLELARLGYARVLSIKPNTTRQPPITQAVTEAEAARRGLWGVCVAKPK
jgi:endonuclease YncB( thermonuclease family)